MSGGLFLFILIIVFAMSTGITYFVVKDKFSFESDFIADIEARQSREDSGRDTTKPARLYGDEKGRTDIEGSVVLRKDTLLIVAEDSIRKFVAPYNVRLIDLYIDKDGGMYIDFGEEIRRQFMGDASEELLMIEGLYKAIRSAVPGFSSLKILIGGNEAESIGGHIDISHPIGEEIAGNFQ